MEINEIINRIGYFRNLKKLSGRELSGRIDKNASYINQLENKKFDIMLYVLLDIIKALEITCDEFFADNFTTYKKDKELMAMIAKLPDTSKAAILEIIKNTNKK